jgi:hypothetical protein
VASKLAGTQLIALTFKAILQQGRRMMATAPGSLAAFIITLPFALLVSDSVGTMQFVFLLLAMVNLLALARVTFAWFGMLVGRDTAAAQLARGGNAEAKHLALLVLFVVVVGAILRASADIPILLYFAMKGVGDAGFFIALFIVLGLLWVPFVYAGAVVALSWVRAVAAGEYGFKAMRDAMRFKRWPLVTALFVLLVSVGFTKAMVADVARFPTTSGVGFSAAGMLISIGMFVIVSVMCAVAYRESVPQAADTAGDPAVLA